MTDDEELKLLKKENSKLKLEARLRKSLSVELERQKGIVQAAKEEAEKQQQLLQKASDRLSKYLSPQICEQIFSDVEFDTGTGRKKLTIFFSDIVNFTSITESMEAEELSGFLNFYLTNMCEIALKYGGTIDKYIGDAVMIFFGDPDSLGVEQDARKCVEMAVAMQKKMNELNGYWGKNFGLKSDLQIRKYLENYLDKKNILLGGAQVKRGRSRVEVFAYVYPMNHSGDDNPLNEEDICKMKEVIANFSIIFGLDFVLLRKYP